MLKRTTMKMMCAAVLMLMSFCAAHAYTPGSVQVSVKDFYSSEPGCRRDGAHAAGQLQRSHR